MRAEAFWLLAQQVHVWSRQALPGKGRPCTIGLKDGPRSNNHAHFNSGLVPSHDRKSKSCHQKGSGYFKSQVLAAGPMTENAVQTQDNNLCELHMLTYTLLMMSDQDHLALNLQMSQFGWSTHA
jgi:hypothetical protein